LPTASASKLWRYYPQALELGDDLAADWFLALWVLAPTPAKAVRPRESRVTSLLRAHRIRRLEAAEVLRILRQKPTSDARRVDTFRPRRRSASCWKGCAARRALPNSVAARASPRRCTMAGQSWRGRKRRLAGNTARAATSALPWKIMPQHRLGLEPAAISVMSVGMG
jgi:hypothetical protein